MSRICEDFQLMRQFLLGFCALTSMAFAPFSEVRNVCPRCPAAPNDLIVLMSKARVSCRVVAQNVDYYVVERLGEVRAVLKSEIASIRRLKKDESTPSTGDQILLKNEVLLHGTITDEKKGLYLTISVQGKPQVAWFDQIKSVHRGGARSPLPQ